MALSGYLARVVLILALIPGCDQSLFDARPGNGGGEDDRDGGEDPPDPPDPPDTDGGAGRPDGGMAGNPDAGGPAPDAAPTREVCPVPCAGDAFGDYNYQQGGLTGRWRYIEVQPEANSESYVDMSEHFFPSAVVGWKGTGVPEPTIAYCHAAESDPPCAELKDLLALTTTNNLSGVHHPALAWTAPTTGVYYMTGTWRVSSTTAPVETTMRITLNNEGSVLEEMPLTLTDTPFPFDIELSVTQGDRIVLSAVASGGVSVSVGVDLFFQGPF
jgi:hypothetical protein